MLIILPERASEVRHHRETAECPGLGLPKRRTAKTNCRLPGSSPNLSVANGQLKPCVTSEQASASGNPISAVGCPTLGGSRHTPGGGNHLFPVQLTPTTKSCAHHFSGLCVANRFGHNDPMSNDKSGSKNRMSLPEKLSVLVMFVVVGGSLLLETDFLTNQHYRQLAFPFVHHVIYKGRDFYLNDFTYRCFQVRLILFLGSMVIFGLIRQERKPV